MEQVIELTKDNIQQVVDSSNNLPIVMLFWAQQSQESLDLLSTIEGLALSQPGRFIVAKVDCKAEQEIASYFRIENVPTCILLKQGQPVDGFVGVQPVEQIHTMLDKHTPPLWQLDLERAKALMADNNIDDAVSLLNAAAAETDNVEVKLVLADARLINNELSAAESLLAEVKLEDQNAYYHTLKKKLELATEAADTPEIRELQALYQAEPGNFIALTKLSKALHQAGRDEEAIAPLYQALLQDLNAGDGEVKQTFLDILTALGQGNTLASQYRRKLYSLLY